MIMLFLLFPDWERDLFSKQNSVCKHYVTRKNIFNVWILVFFFLSYKKMPSHE